MPDSSLPFAPWSGDQRTQAKPATLKRDLLGGLLKQGEKVFVYHKIRMFIPKPGDASQAAAYEIEIDTFNDHFELDKKTT